ncbi:MAG: hypothetical protein AAFV53_09110 [Myxococcota bacterium]
MDGSPQYEVQLDGKQLQLSLYELRQLIEDDKLHAQSRVRAPMSDDWQDARDLIELSDLLQPLSDADPWAAWENMDDDPIEDFPTDEELNAEFSEVYDAEAPTEIALTPIKPSTPTNLAASFTTNLTTNLRNLAAAAPSSADEEEAVADGSPEEDSLTGNASTGEVIRFPETAPPTPTTAHPIPQPLPRMRSPRPVAIPDPPPPARTRLVMSWGRLGLLLTVGGAMAAMVGVYVYQTANPALPPHPNQQALTAEVPVTALAAQATRGDALDTLEDNLRDEMRPGLLPVEREGQLQDALLIEMNHLRLDVASIDAPVTFTGFNGDVPKSAPIEVLVRASDDPDEKPRALAAAAMVIGKYMQGYSLQVPTATLTRQLPDGRTERHDLTPVDAQRLYIKRITISDYLQTDR